MKLKYLESILQSRSSLIPSYCNLHQAMYFRAANLLRTFVIIFYLRMASSQLLWAPTREQPAVHSSTNFLPP